jgi:hypothetical protein
VLCIVYYAHTLDLCRMAGASDQAHPSPNLRPLALRGGINFSREKRPIYSGFTLKNILGHRFVFGMQSVQDPHGPKP